MSEAVLSGLNGVPSSFLGFANPPQVDNIAHVPLDVWYVAPRAHLDNGRQWQGFRIPPRIGAQSPCTIGQKFRPRPRLVAAAEWVT
jgi:hypothetical protein